LRSGRAGGRPTSALRGVSRLALRIRAAATRIPAAQVRKRRAGPGAPRKPPPRRLGPRSV